MSNRLFGLCERKSGSARIRGIHVRRDITKMKFAKLNLKPPMIIGFLEFDIYAPASSLLRPGNAWARMCTSRVAAGEHSLRAWPQI
jgi:hypothetical protein